MASDAGAARGAAVRATADVVETMFMAMSFERECRPAGTLCAPAGPRSFRPRSSSCDEKRDVAKGCSIGKLQTTERLEVAATVGMVDRCA